MELFIHSWLNCLNNTIDKFKMFDVVTLGDLFRTFFTVHTIEYVTFVAINFELEMFHFHELRTFIKIYPFKHFQYLKMFHCLEWLMIAFLTQKSSGIWRYHFCAAPCFYYCFFSLVKLYFIELLTRFMSTRTFYDGVYKWKNSHFQNSR